jgi:hypothetical protein
MRRDQSEPSCKLPDFSRGVVDLTHLNLNDGRQTALEVHLAEGWGIETALHAQGQDGEGLRVQMHREAGGVSFKLVNGEVVAVSAHAVAVNHRAAAPLWRVMERAWLQAGDAHPAMYAHPHRYPEVAAMNLPWAISLFLVPWHHINLDLRDRACHRAKLLMGAMGRDLQRHLH